MFLSITSPYYIIIMLDDRFCIAYMRFTNINTVYIIIVSFITTTIVANADK